MTAPATASPHSLIHSLGTLRLVSPNVEAWRAYGTDVLGLMPVDIDGALGFRWDHYPYRLIIEDGPTPDIAAVSYEVGDEVLDALGDTPGAAEDRMLDLTAVARQQLVEAGVGEIDASGLCTRCETGLFFSHRRDGERTGRQAGFVWRT